MAIAERPMQPQSGGVEPAGPPRRRSWWARPAVHTALLGAVIGYLAGHSLGLLVAGGYLHVKQGDTNDMALVLGYLFATLGWLAGLGVFNDLFRQIAGRPSRPAELEETSGLARYFRYSLDHKVIGIQYLVGMVGYFCTAGLFAMAIRTELLSPTTHVFGPGTYIEIVGEHGTMMMMLMSSVILGPFGNYLVPLMIGSKRTAFPRLSALSFWLTPVAFIVLLSAILWGGFPTGWTGYAPLSNQALQGMDSYLVAFSLMGLSMILAGINISRRSSAIARPGCVGVGCRSSYGRCWRRLF